jgi:hypothetical protein
MAIGAAVVVILAAGGAFAMWRARPADANAAAAPVPAAAATPPAGAAPSDAQPAPPPAVALSPAAAAPDPGSPATPPADASASAAIVAQARRDRDSAITQRDAALAQVRQLTDQVTSCRNTSASAAVAPTAACASAPSGDTATRLAQLQKERDTLRYVVGTRRQLQASNVFDINLYLKQPPSSLTTLNLGTTTEVTIEAKSVGLSRIKDITIIPSSVWQDVDFKFDVGDGSAARITILRPDAFRNFAKYFVIMAE